MEIPKQKWMRTGGTPMTSETTIWCDKDIVVIVILVDEHVFS
jgi:hypothetical protein